MPNTSKPMIRIHNSQTNEIIDREMTAAEFAQYEIDQAANQVRISEMETKATQKASILDRLGLTDEEVTLLLS